MQRRGSVVTLYMSVGMPVILSRKIGTIARIDPTYIPKTMRYNNYGAEVTCNIDTRPLVVNRFSQLARECEVLLRSGCGN